MTPDLEAYLWERIPTMGEGLDNPHPLPRVTINAMVEAGMIASHKQAWRTLEKWADRGWYEYGVSLDCGWKTGRRPAVRALVGDDVGR